MRCSFPPGEATCSPCSARGSRCIDQRDATYIINEEAEASTTLREPVPRLELSQEPRLQATPRQPYQEGQPLNPFHNVTEPSDIGTPASGEDRRAPFVSILDDAEVNITSAS